MASGEAVARRVDRGRTVDRGRRTHAGAAHLARRRADVAHGALPPVRCRRRRRSPRTSSPARVRGGARLLAERVRRSARDDSRACSGAAHLVRAACRASIASMPSSTRSPTRPHASRGSTARSRVCAASRPCTSARPGASYAMRRAALCGSHLSTPGPSSRFPAAPRRPRRASGTATSSCRSRRSCDGAFHVLWKGAA